jgi:ribosome maturation factor RimP
MITIIIIICILPKGGFSRLFLYNSKLFMKNFFNSPLGILLEKIAQEVGLCVVKISFLSLRNNSIEITVDRIDGEKVSIIDCKNYNTKLKEYNDEFSKILGQEYYFDVSSAGVERPLVKIDDFEKFKNNMILIRFKEKLDKKKKIQGKLLGLENNKIKLLVNGRDILIDYDNVSSANIVMTEEVFRKLLSK